MRALVFRPQGLLSTTPFRSSTLSAIHRGLRDSQKARPQGFQALEAASSGGRNGRQTTSRQRRDPDWKAPGYTIKKGKKDITDKGPQPKSRRTRFNDPAESFGKRSQVWQIKHGNLRSEMEKLTRTDEGSQPRRDSFREHARRDQPQGYGSGDRSRRVGFGDRTRKEGFGDRTRRDNFGDRTRNDSFGDRRRDFGASRSDQSDRRRPDGDRPRTERPRVFTRGADRGHREDADNFRPSRQTPAGEQGRDATKQEPRTSTSYGPSLIAKQDHDQATTEKTDVDSHSNGRFTTRDTDNDIPIRIHHTTAASQFLYGRFAVRAALMQGKRQIYRLYVYSGDDRSRVSQDASYAEMAKKHGALICPVTTRQGLNMMDKMANHRPHNGYILEVSPLPQLPVKALSEMTEEGTQKGFRVELNHQSAEDANINGTETFIACNLPTGRYPLVLLLDGILDPGNYGAILRSAAFLGATAVAVTKDNSAGLTPTVHKASAGAAETTTLFGVRSVPGFLEESKLNGWTVLAAAPDTGRVRSNSHLTIDRMEAQDPLGSGPVILVIGSEGEGLNRQVRRCADHTVSIPSPPGLHEDLDSLNASVATALLTHALLKKQTDGLFRSQSVIDKKDDADAMF